MNITPTDGYKITNTGRVYSLSHNWRGYGKREMSYKISPDGYKCVRLTINGQRRERQVHILVAELFVGPKPSEYHQVRHLDGDKLNNHYTNLKWGTAKENAEDREIHLLHKRGKTIIINLLKIRPHYLKEIAAILGRPHISTCALLRKMIYSNEINRISRGLYAHAKNKH